MIRRFLSLLIVTSLLSVPVAAQQKPLVTIGGQTRQLPDGTPLQVNSSVQLPPLPSGDGWWTDDATAPRVIENPGRTFLGMTVAEGAGKNSGTNWVSSNFDHYLVRSNTLTALSRVGGTALFGATRNSDRYRQPALSAPLTIWASGQAVTAGQYRGRFGRRYVAATSGTTGVTPPTHTSGTVSDGGVSWTYVDNRSQFFTPIGVSMLGWSDVDDGEGTWAGYIDLTRGSSGGTSFGLEFGVKNRGGNVVSDPFTVLPGGATIGAWFAAGGDNSYGGAAANPSTAAITIGRNTNSWNSGIVFGSTGLETINGRQRAMQMAPTQALQWYRAPGQTAFEMRADGGVAGRETRMVFNGYTTELRTVRANGAEQTIVGIDSPDMSSTNANADQLYLQPSVSTTGVAGNGFFKLQAAGFNTNVDLRYTTKGAGVHEFGKAGDFGTFSSTPNYFGSKADSVVVAVDGSSGTPTSTSGAAGVFQKFSTANAFNALAGLATKSSSATDARARAVYGEAVDVAGGVTSHVEGGRFQGVLAVGNFGSAYGAICAAGTNSSGPTNPAYLIGCEGEVTKQVGVDAPTYSSLDPNSFSASFLATNGVGVASAKKVDAAFMVNPYSVSSFRTGFLVTSAVDNAGLAVKSGTNLVAGVDLHEAAITFASLWAPNNSPIRFTNSAGTVGLNVLNLDTNNDLQVGADVMNSVVLNTALKLKKVTAAQLPTCVSGNEGTLYAVSDANSATFNATVAGGGSNHVMAYCNGTNWTVH